MKKMLSIILSFTILCILLSSCTSHSVTQTNNSLTVYVTNRGSIENDPMAPPRKFTESVISNFKQEHSEIDVLLYDPSNGDTEMTEEQQDQIFSNDMMTGKGPDVIFTDSSIRTYKMMRGGVFLDLLPLINADKDFDQTNYQQIMLNAGKINDRQYILPISCSMPYLLTMESNLDASGFRPSNCVNSHTYVQEAIHMMEQENGMRIDSSTTMDRAAFVGWATDLVDYSSAKLNLDTPDFRSYQELQKAICQYDHLSGRQTIDSRSSSTVARKEALFYSTGGNIFSTTGAIQRFAHYSTPTIILGRNAEGRVMGTVKKIAAVNANSPNQQLAYDFIKVLADHYYPDDIYNDIPVSYSARKDAQIANEALEIQFSNAPYELVDANGNTIDSWIPEPYTEKIKPFVEETYALAKELEQVTLTSDVLLKASEYFEPYYQDKDSYENCLKTAQGQLAIYLSE